MRITKVSKVGMLAAVAGIMVFSLGLPAYGTTGLNPPTTPSLGDPVVSQNEVQVITLSGLTKTDTWQVGYGGTWAPAASPYLAYNAPTTGTGSVATALTSIAAIGSGNVSVVGLAGKSYVVTFIAGKKATAMDTLQWRIAPSGTAVPAATKYDGGTLSGTDISPHGGYSTATNFCLQCHGVHGGGEFALMWEKSVTAACNTCHALFNTSGTRRDTSKLDTYDAALPQLVGTASKRSAYDVGSLIAPALGGHTIGSEETPDYLNGSSFDTALFEPGSLSANSTMPIEAGASSADDGQGLYCASCHTPHGDFGKLVNAWGTGAPTAVAEQQKITFAKTNEVQTITMTAWATGGSFTLTFGGQTTPPIAYPTTRTAIQLALNDLSSIGGTTPASAVTVGGPSTTGPWVVTFVSGSLAGTDVGPITLTPSGGAAGTVAETVKGGLDDPTIKLWYSAGVPSTLTAAIPVANQTAAGIATALNDLVVGSDPFTVTPVAVTAPAVWTRADGFTVTFGGALSGINQLKLGVKVTAGNGLVTVTEMVNGAGWNGTGAEGLAVYPSNSRNIPARYLDWDPTTKAWWTCTNLTDVVVEAPSATPPTSGVCTTGAQYATVLDAEGQTTYQFGYKLLSSGPNHQYQTVKSYATAYRFADNSSWCGTCHTTRFESGVDAKGNTYHNHTASGGCSACHGNPFDGSSFDYPHSSNVGGLLKAFPDGLCISCHGVGRIP